MKVMPKSADEALVRRMSRLGEDNGMTKDKNIVDHESSHEFNGYGSENVTDPKKGLAEESVYYDKNSGSAIDLSGEKTGVVDVDSIPKILDAVINKTLVLDGSTKENLEGSSIQGTQQNLMAAIDLLDEDEDEIELEFERAAEKVDTHNLYCPNCRSRVTRVILRRRRRQVKQEGLGCLSCFKVFIPSDLLRLIKTKRGRLTTTNHPQLPRGDGNSSIPDSRPDTCGEDDEEEVPVRRPNSSSRPGHDDVTQKPSNLGKHPSLSSPPQVSDHSDVDDHSSNPDSRPEDDEDEVPLRRPNSSSRPPLPTGTLPPGHDHVTHKPSDLGKQYHSLSSPPQVSDHSDEDRLGSHRVDIPSEKPVGDARARLPQDQPPEPGFLEASSKSLEILKSVVYGGLVESITSLSIVSSAAASETATMNIVAIGLANVISGVFVMAYNLRDMKNECPVPAETDEQTDRYQELIGSRDNFLLHFAFAALSFLVFGLIPPAVYGFAFEKTSNKDYTIIAVAVASLICILLLSIGKAYCKREQGFEAYFKTILFHVSTAVAVSGVAYAVGDLIKILIEKLGWFQPSTTPTPANLFKPGINSATPFMASS